MTHQQKINHLVQVARQFLIQHPYDTVHDVSHHQRVWQIAQRIWYQERNKAVGTWLLSNLHQKTS